MWDKTSLHGIIVTMDADPFFSIIKTDGKKLTKSLKGTIRNNYCYLYFTVTGRLAYVLSKLN